MPSEADLRAQLEYRDALLTAQQESSPDGILVVDAEGRIVSQNRLFAEMWGIPDEVIAERSDEKAIASVLSKLARPDEFIAGIRYLYEHRDEKRTDLLELLDGRVFERYSSPVVGPGDRSHGRVWHFHDITERVERENALKASNAGLAVFAYAASHDLSAPLRKIISFVKRLQEGPGAKLDAEGLDYLARISRSAAAAERLVSDLLTLSQVTNEEHPLETVDLNATLDEIRQDLAPEIADSGASITAGRLPLLRAHPVLIHSLLLNLISNAVKFRQAGAAPGVRVDARRDGDAVELTVSDDGIGFDQGYAEKIFQPFLKLNTSNEYRGSGIGLTICRRVVQRYGGTLAAVSEPGKGTTFTVRLPASLLAPV